MTIVILIMYNIKNAGYRQIKNSNVHLPIYQILPHLSFKTT